METNKKNSSATTEAKEGKTCAILAYLLVGIIWYVVDDKKKKNSFIKYHVKQGLVLLIAYLAGIVILGMTIIFAWLIPLYHVVILVLIVIGAINASNGEKKELPLIGKFSNKLNF